jgi:hypothetical protein
LFLHDPAAAVHFVGRVVFVMLRVQRRRQAQEGEAGKKVSEG